MARERQFCVACPRRSAALQSKLQKTISVSQTCILVFSWLHFYSYITALTELMFLILASSLSIVTSILCVSAFAVYVFAQIERSICYCFGFSCDRSQWPSQEGLWMAGCSGCWVLFAPCIRYFLLGQQRVKVHS